MNEARWVMLLIIGMLLSAAGYADDAKLSNADGALLPEVTPSVEALHAEVTNTFRSHLLYPFEAMAYLDHWPRPIADFEF